MRGIIDYSGEKSFVSFITHAGNGSICLCVFCSTVRFVLPSWRIKIKIMSQTLLFDFLHTAPLFLIMDSRHISPLCNLFIYYKKSYRLHSHVRSSGNGCSGYLYLH